jgi:hypothetical protein
VQRRWAVILGGSAIFCLVAGAALSASPTGKAVETETIIVEPDDFSGGDPGFVIPASPAEDEAEPDADTLDPEFAIGNTETFGPPPTIEYDLDQLPLPVRRLREQIIDAAITGDIEKLRLIFEANEGPPLISFDEIDDPIDHLKSLAGDPQGREILAILIEVLDAGFVHVDIGTPDEMYVWPYFARYPLDSLTAPQMVELFKLLTAGDYDDMKIFGTYLFYRAGIAPNGVWKYFLAGD